MGYLKIKEAITERNAFGQEVPVIIIGKIMHFMRKKQCPECKSYIDYKVKYCTRCGVRLEEVRLESEEIENIS